MITTKQPTLDLYLDTLRDCLTGHSFRDGRAPYTAWRYLARCLGLTFSVPMRDEERENGLSWPVNALTMVGQRRLDNVRDCVEEILRNEVPGALVECGVWRGGASIFMAGVVAAHEVRRRIYLCDSFQGLPKPEHAADAGDRHWQWNDVLGVSEQTVRDNFQRFHLWSDDIKLVPGWFSDTLPTLQTGPIALLRADGDLYASTRQILDSLYDQVSPGGFVIIDDYHLPCCRQAVDEFRLERGITEPLREIDGRGVFWARATEVANQARIVPLYHPELKLAASL